MLKYSPADTQLILTCMELKKHYMAKTDIENKEDMSLSQHCTLERKEELQGCNN